VDVKAGTSRDQPRQKGVITRNFGEPSDGLEPSIPSLPSFGGLRWASTALLHNCSTLERRCVCNPENAFSRKNSVLARGRLHKPTTPVPDHPLLRCLPTFQVPNSTTLASGAVT
jgi:hypothetical protein